MSNTPEIIRRGSIRGCVHYEIIVGYIGTCGRCGQVRDYTLSSWGEYGRADYKEKSRKGGIARQQPKAGVNA